MRQKLIYISALILASSVAGGCSGYYAYKTGYGHGYAARDAKTNLDRQTLAAAIKKLPNGRLVLLNTRYHQWMSKHGYDPEKEGIYK